MCITSTFCNSHKIMIACLTHNFIAFNTTVNRLLLWYFALFYSLQKHIYFLVVNLHSILADCITSVFYKLIRQCVGKIWLIGRQNVHRTAVLGYVKYIYCSHYVLMMTVLVHCCRLTVDIVSVTVITLNKFTEFNTIRNCVQFFFSGEF